MSQGMSPHQYSSRLFFEIKLFERLEPFDHGLRENNFLLGVCRPPRLRENINMQRPFNLGRVSLFFEGFHKVLRYVDIFKHTFKFLRELPTAFYVSVCQRLPVFSLASILLSASAEALFARSNRFARSFL
jgi:hypothetical protein